MRISRTELVIGPYVGSDLIAPRPAGCRVLSVGLTLSLPTLAALPYTP